MYSSLRKFEEPKLSIYNLTLVTKMLFTGFAYIPKNALAFAFSSTSSLIKSSFYLFRDFKYFYRVNVKILFE